MLEMHSDMKWLHITCDNLYTTDQRNMSLKFVP